MYPNPVFESYLERAQPGQSWLMAVVRLVAFEYAVAIERPGDGVV